MAIKHFFKILKLFCSGHTIKKSTSWHDTNAVGLKIEIPQAQLVKPLRMIVRMIEDLVARDVPSRTPAFIAVTTVLFLVTTAFFAARIIWRHSHQIQRGWDDAFAMAAYINLIILSAFGYRAAQLGFGKHMDDIPHTRAHALYWFWLYQIFYKILGGLTKLTFCALYHRIFERQDYRKIVWIVSGIIVAGTVAFTFATMFQCIPIAYNWNKTIPGGHCIVFMGFWYTHAVFNTALDVAVFVLPLPLIRTLQMAKRTKIGLASVFALGAFTIAASIVRMVELHSSAQAIAHDPTWGSMPALIWTEIEANTAVICCTLPALRQLAVRTWRTLRGKKGPETPFNSQHSPSRPGGASQDPFADTSHTDPPYSSWNHNTADRPNPLRVPDPQRFGTFSEAHFSPSNQANYETIHLDTLSPTQAPTRPEPLRRPGFLEKLLPLKTFPQNSRRTEDLSAAEEARGGSRTGLKKPLQQTPIAASAFGRRREFFVGSVPGMQPRDAQVDDDGGEGARGLTLEEMLREGSWGKGSSDGMSSHS
ncbi:hypothetical protein DOTSEDRAFT_110929 [Lecanosticta acicola]|uniref:Rhodopsin domain-containing protein n=1 Tax=Lecanosticta acicola TaxID=111012 RepID=A0AAI9E8H1_9PEZI|nr:hypothetical protein DOTSEDRAFT_110929 [Lecanosticta acicola]